MPAAASHAPNGAQQRTRREGEEEEKRHPQQEADSGTAKEERRRRRSQARDAAAAGGATAPGTAKSEGEMVRLAASSSSSSSAAAPPLWRPPSLQRLGSSDSSSSLGVGVGGDAYGAVAPFSIDWLATGNHLCTLGSLGYFLLDSSRVIFGSNSGVTLNALRSLTHIHATPLSHLVDAYAGAASLITHWRLPLSCCVVVGCSNSNMFGLALMFVAGAACYWTDIPSSQVRHLWDDTAPAPEDPDPHPELEVEEDSTYEPPSVVTQSQAYSANEEEQQEQEEDQPRRGRKKKSRGGGDVKMLSVSQQQRQRTQLEHTDRVGLNAPPGAVGGGGGGGGGGRRRGCFSSFRRRVRRFRLWLWHTDAACWAEAFDLLGALLNTVSSLLPYCLPAVAVANRRGVVSYDSVPVSIAIVDLSSMSAWSLSAIVTFYVWRRDKIHMAREQWEQKQRQVEDIAMRKINGGTDSSTSALMPPSTLDSAASSVATATGTVTVDDSSSFSSSSSLSSSLLSDTQPRFTPHRDLRSYVDVLDVSWWSVALNLAASAVYLSACVYGLDLSVSVVQHVERAAARTRASTSSAAAAVASVSAVPSRWLAVAAAPQPKPKPAPGWQPPAVIGLTPQQIQSWVKQQRELDVVGDSLYLLCALCYELEYYQQMHRDRSSHKKLVAERTAREEESLAAEISLVR